MPADVANDASYGSSTDRRGATQWAESEDRAGLVDPALPKCATPAGRLVKRPTSQNAAQLWRSHTRVAAPWSSYASPCILLLRPIGDSS